MPYTHISILAAALAAMLTACSPSDPLQAQAEAYVQLVLELDRYKDKEVDAWFGPRDLEPPAGPAPELADLRVRADALHAAIAATPASDAERSARLQQKASGLSTVLATIQGKPAFAEETETLYGITLPEVDQAAIDAALAELDALLPGTGTLAFRIAAFRNELLIPADKRKAVFERALEECRARTLAHWQLPAEESLMLEWTRDVSTPWHRYDGGYRSTLQLNDLTLAFVGSAVDVACHEGYPGHHAQFVLFEAAAGSAGLPVEETVILLRSPESALREGAAELAVDLAFPFAERVAFERDVLFPLAGLPPERAETSVRIGQLLAQLAPATIPVIRDYYDGIETFNAATFQLERQALVAAPSELLQFVDETGAYSVGYGIMRDRLRHHVLSGSPGSEWETLRSILEHPASSPPATH